MAVDRNRRKTRVGMVISDKMDKTIVVAVEDFVRHSLYGKAVKRGGKVYIKIFPHKSVTKKPAEVRMGSGKGAPEYWVAVVKPGRVMFEIEGVTEAQAREAMRLASHKLPVKCKFAIREDNAEKGGEA